ncbi:MAG: DUF177 domain-containing protein [Lachnospiraceae bacterium]|nr:DUF177 domain-containing protein [Lachnospiraceae bacterium]
MRISLSEVIVSGGTGKKTDVPLEAEKFLFGGIEYAYAKKSPVHIELNYISSKSVRFKAEGSFELEAECSRCLKPVMLPFEINTDTILVLNDDGRACTKDDDELLEYVEDRELDVDGFVNEEIMIGFPMQVLCGEDCKGLCPVCGADLNKGECGCDRVVLDPRMSKIRDLFLQDKEV